MKKWSTKDVIILALIGFLFGGIFLAAGWVYAALEAALTPLGYEPFANSILFGLWVMAAPVAAVLIKKPGSKTVTTVAKGIYKENRNKSGIFRYIFRRSFIQTERTEW